MTEEQQETTLAADDQPSRRGAKTALAIGVVVLVAAGAGVGAYFIGKNGGEDLDAARAAGEQQGQREGAARGAARGYDEGYKDGRKQGYDQTYSRAYQRTYKKAFKDAGLEEPSDKESLPPRSKKKIRASEDSEGSDTPEIQKNR